MTKKSPQVIGYLRVSTAEQDLEKNKADILLMAHQKGLGHVHFIEETASGKTAWRKRQISQTLDSLEDGVLEPSPPKLS